MKLPISWLKSFVNTKLSAEIIADKLTMAGLEVDEIIGGSSFSGVVVGHVLTVEDHPNADKLHVARVDVGSETLQIVCGAANLEKGQKVAAALVGAKLAEYDITKATLRGVDSFGMLCSERELGISEEHAGIMVLPEKAKSGDDVSLYLGSEKVLDVKVLANRPDCMSIIGLANEVATVTGSKSVIPTIKVSEKGEAEKISVTVENEVLCPRYMARIVKGVSQKESPAWMKERLLSTGVRPINLLVDISNYVMLEYGQPLHFFDLDRLSDKTIIVRSAKAGETLITLDGVSRKLGKENLVIANSKKVIALAGVMGGATTEIDDNTTNVMIEAAIFDKASIRKTSRAMGLRSEAVARFEKGIAHTLPGVAIDRAAELLADLADGTITKTLIDIHGPLVLNRQIDFSVEKMNKFLGTDISAKQAEGVLTALGFSIEKNVEKIIITTPLWRTDVLEPVDVYEEIIRILGYDKVPYTLPFAVGGVPGVNKAWALASAVRQKMSAIGFSEIMTYSFVGETELSAIGIDAKVAPEVQNPLVKDQQYLRPSLVPRMLEALRENQFNEESLYFYEIGKTFEKTQGGKLPFETTVLSMGVLGGTSWPIAYKKSSDFYDLKGAIQSLLSSLGIAKDELVIKTSELGYTKKGISADMYLGGKKFASVGEIREEVRDKFGIKRSVAIATLNLDIVGTASNSLRKFTEISKYQEVRRDISAIFSQDVMTADIRLKLMRAHKLLTNVEITDIFSGKNLTNGDRSITFRLFIQSSDHTLTDAEVDEVVKVCTGKIADLGGKLRSGE